MTEGVLPPLSRVIPCSSVANASSLLTVADASGSDLIHFCVIPCSSVANASALVTVGRFIDWVRFVLLK